MTLDSIISQTFDDYEVIVIDDGSKDNSVEVIKEYKKKYPKIRLLQHKGRVNKGLPESVKHACKNAKGKWIAFCESDDYWDKNHLQEKVNFIKQHPNVSMIVNDIHKFSDDMSLGDLERDDERFMKLNKYKVPHNMFCDLYAKNMVPTFSCVMVKKETLDKCDFNAPVPAWLDWWLWRQISFSNLVGFVSKKLTYWRIHRDSYLNKANKKLRISRSFISNSNEIIKEKYSKGSFYKRMFFIPQVLMNYFFRKLVKVKIKDGYVRISCLGIRILKIKSR